MLIYFLFTLLSALLHATWNSLIKSGPNRFFSMGVMCMVESVGGLILMIMFGLPEPETVLFIVFSVLFRFVYKIALLNAYRFGDLSIVYPIARGISPVLATVGSVIFADEFLSALGIFGILTIATGIMFQLSGATSKNPIRKEAVGLALLCGVMIACYTIVDGLGARMSANVNTYIGALFFSEIISGIMFLVYSYMKRGEYSLGLIYRNAMGGIFSFCAYALVIYSAVHLPLGIVSAVRESGVIFATLIGVFLLGEAAGYRRIMSSIIVFSGLAILLLQVSGIFN